MKRLIAIVGLVLSVVGFGACGGSLYWMWSLQKPLMDKTGRAFATVDATLGITESTIDSVRGNLEASRKHVQIVCHTTDDRNKEASLLERTIARTAAKQISPNVNDVQHSLERVTEASIVVNSILESLRDVEGVEKLDNNQVRDLQTKIDGVTRASLDLGELLDDPRQRRDGESAADRSNRIAANLDLVIQLVDQFRRGVSALRQKVQFYQSKSAWWLERGPTYVSVALGWIIISQLVVLAVSLRGLRRRVE